MGKGMGVGMGAAENGAAWEAFLHPKSPFDGGRWVGTFRGYAKKMAAWAGGVACGGKPAPCNHGELFPDCEAAVYGFDLQDPAIADVVEHAREAGVLIHYISALTLDRLLRGEVRRGEAR